MPDAEEIVVQEKKISIASAKPLSELTPQERKARYRMLRERSLQARTQVEGDPSKHYFWANKTDDPEMIRLDAMGYTIVREPNVEEVKAGKRKPKITAQGLRDDGTYVIGDVILMECALEDYEFFILDIEERHEQNKSAVVDEFRDTAEKQGVPTFTVDRSQQ